MSNGAMETSTATATSATERFLTFRMDRVERDLDRIERLLEQVIDRDALLRENLTKAMHDLTLRQEDTQRKLSEVVDLMKPIVDDYRQRTYGQTYISKYFSSSRYMAALALAAAILMLLPLLPTLVTYLVRSIGAH